jgi:nickel superoxide dismutase
VTEVDIPVEVEMRIVEKLLQPRYQAHAHCDLFCGVYDPAQAMIEAMSCLKTAQKYAASDDEVFRARCISIKEERAELVKHHIWVLWTDFFEPKHVEEFPGLHDLIWRTTKAAGDAKKSMDVAASQKMIDLIQEVSDVFWQTEKAQGAGVYPPS